MHISIPGDWASNSLVFAISRGSCTATPSTPPQRSALSRHAAFPSRFRVQVGRVTQRHAPSEPLLPAGAIQRRVRRRNFALRTAFPSPLVRRYSHDYYGACVTIGLAPLRRSRVRPCHTYRARLRRPTHLLECPHWASPRATEVALARFGGQHTARRRFHASFRRTTHLRLLEIGIQAV